MRLNSGYFRHSLDAHTDARLQTLIDSMGMAGYGQYFILLELYGAAYSKTNEGEPVRLHIRSIAAAWRQRTDYCLLSLSKAAATGLLRYRNEGATIELDIPNFSKYFGTKNTNKIREDKIREDNIRRETHTSPAAAQKKKRAPKPSKILLEYSPLEAFSTNPEVVAWLRDTKLLDLQQRLADTYDSDYLANTIEKAYYWQLENKKREAGTFLSSWIDRDRGKKFKGGLSEADRNFKNFFDERIIAAGMSIPEGTEV